MVPLFATDTNTGRLTPIVKALLERGGFAVDMQAMDWQTVLSRRARKEALAVGGWPCDAKIEELHDAFAKTTDPAERKEFAEAVQVRESKYPTFAHLGQFNIPVARRKTVTGNLEAPAPVFWNVRKKE